MSYESIRDPRLPWGYWLRAVAGGPAPTTLVDEDGRYWGSVREAYWCGRLGMPGRSSGSFDRDVEMLFGVLIAINRRDLTTEEAVIDMFQGDSHYHAFYRHWLHSAGLLAPTTNGPFPAPLSAEGRAVLLMLAATRPQVFWAIPTGADTIEALTEPRPSSAARDRWFDRTEAFSAQLQFRFLRQTIYGRSAIILIGDALGTTMPIGRTLWSQLFDDAETRNRFHHWLCVRLDRWAVWGDTAYMHGAAHLSQHLLALVVAGMEAGGSDRAPLLAIGDD